MDSALATVPSSDLLQRLGDLVRRDRLAEVDLLVHLGEVDARRLYLERACGSMFQFCVRILHFAEAVAFKRIQVARAARRHPELLAAIRRGDLHVTAASLPVPRLTRENVRELVGAARHKTTEQVRALLADRRPRADVPTSVRRVPAVGMLAPAEASVRSTAPAARAPQLAAARPSVPAATSAPEAARPEPLGGERYCIRFTADGETWARLKELRALMRHQVPDGDVGKILSRAIAALLAQVRKQKLGACDRPPSTKVERPRPSRSQGASPSRTIPAAIRREVFRRDGGRCTYVSAAGRRCGERAFIQFHHIDPWARSRRHSVEAITLRCRAHNQYQAERDFGTRHMARFRKAKAGSPGTGSGSGSSRPDTDRSLRADAPRRQAGSARAQPSGDDRPRRRSARSGGGRADASLSDGAVAMLLAVSWVQRFRTSPRPRS